jgi:hypothetical protein
VILSLAAYLGYPGLSSDILSGSEIRQIRKHSGAGSDGKDPQKFRRLFLPGLFPLLYPV